MCTDVYRNKRPTVGEELIFDHYTEQHVTPSAATLIIRYARQSRLCDNTNNIKPLDRKSVV